MRLQVLHVSGCPNAAVLTARLIELASGHASVEPHIVRDLDEATMLGMNGSPTLLVDGADPFARPDLLPSLSCRLYPDENGSISGAPTMAQLRKIFPWQGHADA